MNKLLPFLVVGLFFLSLISIGSSDWNLTPNDKYEIGNETYSFTHDMVFSDIVTGGSTWIKFNTTDFNVTSANNIYINLSFLHENFSNASVGDSCLTFYANTTAGTVWFNLSGFENKSAYTVYRDDIAFQLLTSNVTGTISFNNSVWSEHKFDIIKSSQTIQINYISSLFGSETNLLFIGFTLMGVLAIALVASAIIRIINKNNKELDYGKSK